MDTTRRRMIQIAVLVTGFAVGMAGLLNYFKYLSTADRLITERLSFTAQQIENSVQQQLALGLQFSDLGTLPATLQRLLSTDPITTGIEIFDVDGKLLYTTDQMRAKLPVPQAWVEAARRSGEQDWHVHDGAVAAVGSAIQNHFGLVVGHVALRYDKRQVEAAASKVARELALSTGAVFLVSALVSSLAMLAVMNSLSRNARRLEEALRSGDPGRATAAARGGPFAAALKSFVETVRGAETQITELRGQLHRGVRP